MTKLALTLILIATFTGCDKPKSKTSESAKPEASMDQTNNMLSKFTQQDLNGFQWFNSPENFEVLESAIRITPGENSDFFVNPEDGKITATAPLLYKEIEGDFVATALVKPDFSAVWNAATLMVHLDSTNWIKLAFENSDATGKSVVSVVTKGTSDDANGVILNDQNSIWLRVIRKGDIYALHWSKNGEDFKMARLTALPHKEAVKIGMGAQCPVSKPATHEFLYFSLEQKTVDDLRKGM